MARTGPTNVELTEFLQVLAPKTVSSPFWKRISKDLQKATRQRRTVNVYKIQKYCRDNESIAVPGKVLSVGEINKKVTVAALSFSKGAREKIEKAQGRAIPLSQLFEENPDAKNVRILG